MTQTMLGGLTMPPCSKLLGWRLIETDPANGRIKVGFDGKRDFCNPSGFIQGGFLVAMMDDTMGPAVFVMTEGREYTPTITLTANFLSPAKVGPLICEAKVVQKGKAVVFVEAKLTDEAGALIATATSTSRLVDASKVRR